MASAAVTGGAAAVDRLGGEHGREVPDGSESLRRTAAGQGAPGLTQLGAKRAIDGVHCAGDETRLGAGKPGHHASHLFRPCRGA